MSVPTPYYRPRRMRATEPLRAFVRETSLDASDLIAPLFVDETTTTPVEVSSMPGVYRYTVDTIAAEARELFEKGVPAVILFGIPAEKDDRASQAYDDNGIVQRAIRAIKAEVPAMMVITDVCLCEYMDHGHCGILDERGVVLNDPTLELLCKEAVSHAKAGADMVAPSDMMDGRIAAMRYALDEAGFSELPIMSYAVKYASAFYGPFRDAADSAPSCGDRKSYQMDPANTDEAMREAQADIEEGADMIMVKPGMPYLDVLQRVTEGFNFPTVAYNVSGEYAMVKAAAINGWIDERKVVMETMLSFKRAGACAIITYHAKDVATWLAQ